MDVVVKRDVISREKPQVSTVITVELIYCYLWRSKSQV